MFAIFEQVHDAIGRARRENLPADDQRADIVEMEAVDILLRRDCLQHLGHVDVLGQRQLNEDAVDIVICIELADQDQQLLVGDRGWQAMAGRLDADRFAGLDLARDVDLRGGIFADKHDRQAGRHALGLQCLDMRLLVIAHLPRDGLAVDDLGTGLLFDFECGHAVGHCLSMGFFQGTAGT